MTHEEPFYPLRYETVNPALVANTVKSVEALFPIETEDGSVSIRASNIKIDTTKVDPQALNAHQTARQTGKTLEAPVYADLKLFQNGKQTQTLTKYNLGGVPLMNALGTFMVNGNDYYTPMAQLRLKPGAYTREKTNGEYETFIPMKGAQLSVWMDPARGILKLGFYATNVSWYAVVKALGASDDEIVRVLGNDKRARELLEANKLDRPEADIKKLFLAIFERNVNRDLVRAGVQKRDMTLAAVDYAGQVAALKHWLDGQEVDPYVTNKTLGKQISKVGLDLLLQSARRILSVSRQESEPDDRDALEFKAAVGVEEMLPERITKQTKYLQRKVLSRLRGGDVSLTQAFGKSWLSPVTVSYFGGTENIEGGLANTAEAANPLAILSEQTKLTVTGEGGITSDHAIPMGSRLFRPSSVNFIDSCHTPEGQKIGIMTHAAVNVIKEGTELKAPFYKCQHGRMDSSKLIYLNTRTAADSVVGYPEYFDEDGKAKSDEVRANVKGEIKNVNPSEVEYVIPSGVSAFDHTSNAAILLAHTHPNRAMMAGKHLTQALPLVHRESPLMSLMTQGGRNVLESLARTFTIRSRVAGKVEKIEPNGITVAGVRHEIYDNYPMQAKVSLHHYPVVKVGDTVKKGDLIADSNYSRDGKLALGTNLRSAYMPWKNASNFEDALLISQSAAKKLTSEHMHRMALDLVPEITVGKDLTFAQFPTKFTADSFAKLDKNGIIKEGSQVKPGDPLIAAVRKSDIDAMDRRSENLARIHKALLRPYRDASVYWDEIFPGVVYRVVKTRDKVEVHVKTEEPMQIGDKISMSSAAKGTIAQIVDDDKMPHGKDGKHVEVIFNTIGVAGRINPSQTIEQAIGKLVRDGGGQYSVTNFDNVHHAREVAKALAAKGLKHEEELFDPETGKWLEKPVATGYNYVVKLDHPVRKKFSARTTGSYTMDETPTSGGGKGGQSYDQLTTYALLGHNAHALIGESVGVRGTKNDDYWRAYQAGETPPPPKVPFAFHKLEAYLNAAGVDTQTHGTVMNFLPMTDKRVLERSHGVITNATLLKTRSGKDKSLAEERGGLFDPHITGGIFGDRWSHIDLAEKLPHPLFEKVTRDITGMKTADYYGLLAHTRHYDPQSKKFVEDKTSHTLTGSAAFEHLLKFDPDEKLKEVKAKLKTAVGSDQNKLNRATRYLRGLKETGLSAQDAYLMKVVPVLPPTYRGISELSGGALRVADSNLLYRDVLLTNEQLTKAKEQGLPAEHLADARTTLYKSVGALIGVNNPLTHREDREDAKGLIDTIKGKNNKEGFFQRVVARRRNDFTGRSTIEPDANLGVDEIGIPEEMAWHVFQAPVVRRLVSLGYKPADAAKAFEEHKPEARQALMAEMEHRPVLYNRSPSLHRWSVAAAKATMTPGKEIKISPGVVGPFNADFDGNCISGMSKIVLMFESDAVKSSSCDTDVVSKLGEKFRMKFSADSVVVCHEEEKSLIELQIKDVPYLPETMQLDKNGARVYLTPPGLSVWSYDHEQGQSVLSGVSGLTIEENVETSKVETSRGFEVIASDNDSLCIYDHATGAVRKCAPSESIGKLVPTCSVIPRINDGEGNFDLGWMIGAFVGDGFVTGNLIGFTKLNDDVRNKFDSTLCQFMGRVVAKKTYRGEAALNKLGSSVKDHYVCDTNFFKQECYAPGRQENERSALYKKLPNLFEFNKETLFGILSGLFDTDGSICEGNIGRNKDGTGQIMLSYSTSSVFLRDDILRLGLLLGIRVSYSTVYPKAGRLQKVPNFCVYFSSVDMFALIDELKLVTNNKQATLHRLKESFDDRDIVPVPNKIMEWFSFKSFGLKVDKSLWSCLNTIKSKSKPNYSVARDTAKRMLTILSGSNYAADPIVTRWKNVVESTTTRWDRVKTVTPNGRITVYDLIVEKTKVFVTNGGLVIYDTMSVTVPITEEARRESYKLLPSKNLFYDRDRSLAYGLDKDVVTGIFVLTTPGTPSGLTFDSEADAITAYKNNKNSNLKMGSLVTIKGKGQQAIGWLIFQQLLPPRFQTGLSAPVDGKKLKALLERIAKESPGDYNVISRRLMQAGFTAVAQAGGISSTVTELNINRTQIDRLLAQMEKDINKGKTYQEKQKLALEANEKYKPLIHAELQKHFDAQDIGYKTLLESKASGKINMDSMNQMFGSPMLVSDVHDQIVPAVIKGAYGSGMSLSDYVLTTPGARKGLVAKSLSTALPGFLAKEIAANMGPIRIETKDCNTQIGITLELDPDDKMRGHDADLLDRHLLHDIPSIHAKRNDMVTPEMLSRLRDKKVKSIEVRSPMTCKAPNPPCQLCVGRDPTGHLWPIGTNIGLNYGQGISERSTQLTLKLFHSGGTIGSGDSLTKGFQRFRELLAAPETIADQGTLADADGQVVSVQLAPQGGHYVSIRPPSGVEVKQHILQGRIVKVTPGQKVKIGDPLSDGSYRPQEIATKKGLLAAQQYVVDQARKSYMDAGEVIRKPTLEVLVGMMRYMEITDDGGEKDLAKGDVIHENDFEARRKHNPRIQGKPTVPGISSKPLLSQDLFERLNFRELESAIRDVPASGGKSDLTGNHSPISGIAYGAKFRMAPNFVREE